MSRKQARPRPPTFRRSEIVIEPDGRAHTSFLWEDFVPGRRSREIVPDRLTPSPILELHRGLLACCEVCPHRCGVNRLAGELGRCKAGESLRISRWGPEFGEEPCLVGPHGSGVVFFSDCHLSCVFCHNYEATQEGVGESLTLEDLVSILLRLDRLGCSNLHFISPTHYAPQVADAIAAIRSAGVGIPVVYNCSGYESVSILKRLEGLVDVYLPDFKFGPDEPSAWLAGAPYYFETALTAIAEMARQVGPLELDPKGLARRGLLVRHLVMPSRVESSRRILSAIRESLGAEVTLHLMSSYHPAYRAFSRPDLARRTSAREYEDAVAFARSLGFRPLVDGKTH